MAIDAVLNEELNAACAVWLRDIAQGNEGALSAMYDATLGKCYALALRITRLRESAEEVVCDTFMQVWRDAARYDPARGQPLAWLLSICRSRAIDHLRQRDRAEAHEDPASLLSEAVVDQDDPLRIALAFEAGSAVRKAIAGLPKVSQQLLALAFYRGLSHQEIADHLGMPLGTVKTHLRRAQEALRAAVGENLE